MLLDDTATFLAANSTAFAILSGTTGNLAKAISLDADSIPDTLTVLYETPGTAPEHTFSATTGQVTRAFEQPTLQILTRSTSYATARTRADTAFTLLDGVAGRSLTTAATPTYLSITADQSPFFLQRDRNDRYVLSQNFTVWKTTG